MDIVVLKKFFLNKNDGLIIKMFSISHFLLIVAVLIIICLIFYKCEKFKNLNDTSKKKIRFSLAIILLINFLVRRGSFIYFGVYDWHFHLDINFCNFTSILFFLYSLTGNKKIYSLCYYLAFIGPLMAIIFPSVNFSPLNYSFYSFLILHHLVFIYNFIFLYIENYKYDSKDFKKVCMFIFLYFMIIYIFDYIFKTDYNKPETFLNNDIIYLFSKLFIYKYLILFIIIIILLLNGRKILKIIN